MIELLIKDPVFIASIEEDTGKLLRVWADWPNYRIVYEIYNGEIKESDIGKILLLLKRIEYMKDFEH